MAQIRGIREYSTPADLLEYQQTARTVAEELLIDQKADLTTADSAKVHVRNAIVDEDLNVNSDGVTAVVSNTDPVWQIDTAAGDEEDWYGYYAFESQNNLENKAAVIYGIQFLNPDEDLTLPASTLRVKNSTGGTVDIIDISSLDNADGKTLLFDDPLALGTKDAYFEVYLESGAADSAFPVKPLIAVAEEEGDTLESSDRFVRSQ